MKKLLVILVLLCPSILMAAIPDAYSSGTTYDQYDAVSYHNSVWVSKAGSNVGNTPAVGSSSWQWAMEVFEKDGSTRTNYVVGVKPLLMVPFYSGEYPSGTCPQPVVIDPSGHTATAIADGNWQSNTGTSQGSLATQWADGSAMLVPMAFKLPSLAANSSAIIIFTSRSGSDCTFTGLSKSSMYTFNSSNWSSQILVTANSVTATVDGRDAINTLTVADRKIEYLRIGPLVTQIKVQDATTATSLSLGANWDGSTMGMNSGAFYAGNCGGAGTCYASLAPIFYYTFDSADNVVREDFSIHNVWSIRSQNQQYSFVLKTGSTPTQVYSKSLFTQYAGQVWRKTFYSGTEPGNIQIDHNEAHLFASAVLPYYDATKSGDPTTTGDANDGKTSNSQWAAGDKGDIGGGATVNAMSIGFSDNSEGAPIQREDMLYFSNMLTCGTANGFCAKAYQMLTGMSGVADSSIHSADVAGGAGTIAVQGNMPFNVLDNRSGNFYNDCYDPLVSPNTKSDGSASSGCGVTVGDAFGRPLSRDAHLSGAICCGGSAITSVGTQTLGGWTNNDLAHWQDWEGPMYMVTGDPYLRDMIYYGASWALWVLNYDSTGSNGANKFFNATTRAQAWGVQANLRAALISQPNTPENLYYMSVVNSYAAVIEGFKGFRNGVGGITSSLTPTSPNTSCTAYSTTANRWNFGHCTYGNASTITGATFPVLHDLTPGFCVTADVYQPMCDLTGSTSANPAVVGIGTCSQGDESKLNGYPPYIWGATNAGGSQNWTTLNCVTSWDNATNCSTGAIDTGAHTMTLSTPARNTTGKTQPMTGTVYAAINDVDMSKTSYMTESWIDNFAAMVMTEAYEAGFTNLQNIQVDNLKRPTEQLLDASLGNPYLSQSYEAPVRKWASATWPPTCDATSAQTGFVQTWADWKDRFNPGWQTMDTFNNGTTYIQGCADHGYALAMYAAVQGASNISTTCSQGDCTGAQAQAWLTTHFPYWNNSPTGSTGCGSADTQIKFSLAPRPQINAPSITACNSLSPSSATIAILGTQSYAADCTFSDSSTGPCTPSLSSGTPSVATVAGVIATGVSGGSSTISATAGGFDCGNTSALTVTVAAAGGSVMTPGVKMLPGTILK